MMTFLPSDFGKPVVSVESINRSDILRKRPVDFPHHKDDKPISAWGQSSVGSAGSPKKIATEHFLHGAKEGVRKRMPNFKIPICHGRSHPGIQVENTMAAPEASLTS